MLFVRCPSTTVFITFLLVFDQTHKCNYCGKRFTESHELKSILEFIQENDYLNVIFVQYHSNNHPLYMHTKNDIKIADTFDFELY